MFGPCLQCVILGFPGRTQLFFLTYKDFGHTQILTFRSICAWNDFSAYTFNKHGKSSK